MQRWTALGLACGVLWGVGPVAPAAAQDATLSQLVGLTPPELRERLVPGSVGWPPPTAFEVAAGDGVLSFVALDTLTMDPVLAQRAMAYRTNGEPPKEQPLVRCEGSLRGEDGALESAHSVILAFRDGRLEGAAQLIVPPLPPLPKTTDPAALQAAFRRPVVSPFEARLGELPLADGLGFLDRWRRRPLGAGDRLSIVCAPPPQQPLKAEPRRRGLDAGDLQGLALLPFAIVLPAMNAQRAAARRDGAALLASIKVGTPLGEDAQAYAARHKGVRAHRAREGDYAVLTIDLGASPGRNLSNFNDAALVGVRDGRIAWISPPAGPGPGPRLLCLDARGVPGAARRGCSSWGHYSP